jgi:cation diffusion facilitator CzcD-associated flavoprotein CzcO
MMVIDWSHFYAKGAEIRQHIKNTSKKFDLRKNIRFNSKLLEAKWNEEKGKWQVKVVQAGAIINDEAEVVFNASGVLK